MRKFVVFAAFAFVLLGASLTARAESFTAYLTPLQEVPPSGTAAFGKAHVVLDPVNLTITYTVVFNNLGSAQILAHIHGPAAVGVSAPVLITFPVAGGTSGTITGSSPITVAQIAQLRSGLYYVNIHSTNFPNGEMRGQLLPNRFIDYDGDGRTDPSVLRFPTVAPPGVAQIAYYNLRSTDGPTSASFGDANTDFPAPGDYDGDGKDDIALFRSGTTAGSDDFFLILNSSNNTFRAVRWGVMGDQAVAHDYDGDGITDIAIYRRGVNAGDQTYFYIRTLNGTQVSIPFGTTGDVAGGTTGDTPVVGDYDGDGKADLAVYRFGGLTPNNCFIVKRSSDGVIVYQNWGNFQTDYVAPGDFDGDGKTDYVAVRTGATGTSPMTWYILRSSDGGVTVRTFGISSDRVVQGDYDGDGKTDIAVWRTATSVFYVHNSLSGTDTGTGWGAAGDFPANTVDAR